MIDDHLHFEVNMMEDMPGENDPDLNPSIPIELDSAANCDAAKPKGGESTEWQTFVFKRRR
jgi:hypothetical protein